MTFNNFHQIGQKLQKSLAQVARDTALDIQTGYQANCRVDTGFMQDSAYVVSSDSSTYHGGGDARMLPEVAPPTSDTEATAAVGADYAMINEVGGVHMVGDGAMARAVDAVQGGPFQVRLSAADWKP